MNQALRPQDMLPRLQIMGTPVTPLRFARALSVIDNWVRQDARRYVCVRDAHGVVLGRDDPELRRIHAEAGLVTTDGMPLVWLCRLHGHHDAERVYGPDLLEGLSALSARKAYRQFYFGGAPGVAERLSHALTARHPGLITAGCFSPPFHAVTREEDEAMVQMINDARPDILWVGLSTPKQERWMAAHLGRIHAPVMIGVGAAFDFLAGLKPQAPRLLQRAGLEWLYRLMSEPRRLGPRYLRVVPRFAFYGVREFAGHLCKFRRGGRA